MSAKSDLDADYELLKKQHYKNGAPVIGVPVIADVSDRKAARGRNVHDTGRNNRAGRADLVFDRHE